MDYIPYDDLQERFLQEVAAGLGPDIILGAGEWGPRLYDQGAVLVLPDRFLIDVQKALTPPALNAIYYNNIPISLPFSIQGIVMYRNTSIMPKVPRTFEELVSYAQTTTKGRIIGAYLERGDLFAFAQLTACGGSLMFPNGYPAFNNSSGLCWINLLNLYEVAGPVSFNSDDDLRRFKAGTIGVIFAGTWDLPDIQEALGEDLAIDPWPKYGVSHLSGYVWTENVYFRANLNGDDLDQAMAFSQYLLSPEGQTRLARTGKIPAIIYRDVQDKVTFQVVAALKDGTNFPVIPEMDLYRGPMHKVLLAIFEENNIPEVVLGNAESEILDLINSSSVEDDDI
jgi:maltose-binding protein MalE